MRRASVPCERPELFELDDLLVLEDLVELLALAIVHALLDFFETVDSSVIRRGLLVLGRLSLLLEVMVVVTSVEVRELLGSCLLLLLV